MYGFLIVVAHLKIYSICLFFQAKIIIFCSVYNGVSCIYIYKITIKMYLPEIPNGSH